MGQALTDLAELARLKGDLSHAMTLLQQALAGATDRQERWSAAIVATLLGHLARQQQDWVLARDYYRESLTMLQTFKSPTFIAWSLEGYAMLLISEGHMAQATRLLAAAASLRMRADTPLPPSEREAFEGAVVAAKSALSEPAFAYEWAIGSGLGLDGAIAEALSQPDQGLLSSPAL